MQRRGHPDILARPPAGAHRALPCLWLRLQEARHRTPADQAIPSLDQRSGRADEPHRQDATIKTFHYPSLESLKAHVIAFVSAYNFAKHLKAIRWKTPFEAVCHAWNTTPQIFKLDPPHLIPGPNT